jgi:peptidyl-tRNA hydrolase, PTH1 family
VKAIIGLGNPGTHYQWSRHNIGFLVVDRFAGIEHIPICTRRFKTLYGKGRIDSKEVVLIKPMTFMNLSGEAVRKAIHFFHIGMEDLIVVHDDLDLIFGRLRFKRRGGDGGHQGVRSLIAALNGSGFLRLKVGIGRPPEDTDPAEYVLERFPAIQQLDLDRILSQAAESLQVMLLEGVEAAMNRYQKKSIPPFQTP